MEVVGRVDVVVAPGVVDEVERRAVVVDVFGPVDGPVDGVVDGPVDGVVVPVDPAFNRSRI